MGDIIKILSDIGTNYLEDEKRVKNKAYEYNIVKVYLFDIENKQIEPSLNIPKDDIIISRFGVGANSGNLFPNIFFKSKDINVNFDKFVKAIHKSNNNLLSYFSLEEIYRDKILSLVYGVENRAYGVLNSLSYSTDEVSFTLLDYDYQLSIFKRDFFESSKESISKLEEYKKEKAQKGKATTYYALS